MCIRKAGDLRRKAVNEYCRESPRPGDETSDTCGRMGEAVVPSGRQQGGDLSTDARPEGVIFPRKGELPMSDPVVVPRVDAEFMALIPPLTADEKALLEESLTREGCRDALVVWAGKNILLDGHTRLDICQRRGIEYRTVEVELPDREAAADWIDRNQLGRRNLTPSQMKELIGRRYNRAKKPVPNPQGVGGKSGKIVKDQNDPQQSTAERLGKEHGVSPATVKRAGKFAEAVEKVKPIDPDIEQKVMAGTAPPKAVIEEAAKLVDEKPEAAKKVLDAPPKKKEKKPKVPRAPGKAIEFAHRAIALLMKISMKDPQRGRGLDIVRDWIENNR